MVAFELCMETGVFRPIYEWALIWEIGGFLSGCLNDFFFGVNSNLNVMFRNYISDDFV